MVVRRGRNRLVQPEEEQEIQKDQIDPSVLLKMKDEINEKKEQVSELEGSKKTLLSQLADYGCKTVEEANKLIKKKREEQEKKQGQLTTGIESLLEEYDWDFQEN